LLQLPQSLQGLLHLGRGHHLWQVGNEVLVALIAQACRATCCLLAPLLLRFCRQLLLLLLLLGWRGWEAGGWCGGIVRHWMLGAFGRCCGVAVGWQQCCGAVGVRGGGAVCAAGVLLALLLRLRAVCCCLSVFWGVLLLRGCCCSECSAGTDWVLWVLPVACCAPGRCLLCCLVC
jgi:hypothetical protein